ncbi:MAG: SpoIIE family protein phosphatase [Vicingaceae bacterium]
MKRQATFRNYVSRFLFFPTLFASILVLSYLYWDLHGLEDELIEEQMQEYESLVQEKLENFFNPIEQRISYQNSLIAIENDSLFHDGLIDGLFQFLKYSPQVSSLMLAKPSGEELMLLELDEEFFLRQTKYQDGKVKRSFFKASSTDQLHWNLETQPDLNLEPYDSRIRPWFKNAINHPENSIYWTKPYLFFTTKELGITASSLIKTKSDSLILAYDIKLNDLSEFTSNIKIEENGRVFILSQDTLVLALPHLKKSNFADTAYFLEEAHKLPSPLYKTVINHWKKNQQASQEFDFENDEWKYKVQPFPLGNQTFYIVKLLNRKDFTNSLSRFRYTLIGGIVLLSLFILRIVRGYRRKHKTNILLEKQKNKIEKYSNSLNEQKQLVEAAYQETIDSITYAKRIQLACLPKIENFNEIFEKAFLWFQPKDIVSGDFYWFGKSKKKKWVIAADCTGHGVPGALLSILGSVYINALILNFGVTRPSKLLNKLRELVVEGLKEQEENAPHDGMDIAALCFEEDFSRVIFAGAKNPLYLLRKGEVKIFKADRMAIGFEGEETINDFSEHEIELQKGDELFIFSDGLADQFGGEKGKKFMYKRIRDYLLEWEHLEMEVKKQNFVAAFEKWKGAAEQVDDIILVGISI